MSTYPWPPYSLRVFSSFILLSSTFLLLPEFTWDFLLPIQRQYKVSNRGNTKYLQNNKWIKTLINKSHSPICHTFIHIQEEIAVDNCWNPRDEEYLIPQLILLISVWLKVTVSNCLFCYCYLTQSVLPKTWRIVCSYSSLFQISGPFIILKAKE